MLDTYRIRSFDELIQHAELLSYDNPQEWVLSMKKDYGGWVSCVMVELTPSEFFELINIVRFVRKQGGNYEQ